MKFALGHTRSYRAAVAGLLALTLAGCAAFQSNPVPAPPPPPEPPGLASVGGPDDPGQWLERNEAGDVVAFVPLKQARQAVSGAAGSEAVAEYAADELETARTALSRAEKRWQAIASAPLDQPDELTGAAYHAHQAKRWGQITLHIGEREVGLRRLADAQATLEKRDARDERWVGQQLIPGEFGEVRFARGTARLTGDSDAAIQRLAEFLGQHDRYGLRLIGHTDDTAPSASDLRAFLDEYPELAERTQDERARIGAYNKAMSRRRAESVRQALVETGIEGGRLRIEARGASEPVADNATAAGRRDNRRVEAVVILPNGGDQS